MFRYSLNVSTNELKSKTKLSINKDTTPFVPSNRILPGDFVPIIINDEITLRKWGFITVNEEVIITIPEENYSPDIFSSCWIPLTGYYISDEKTCLLVHIDKMDVFYAHGVITKNSEVLFVTREEFCMLPQPKQTPIVSLSLNPSVENIHLDYRQISKLSLSNSTYNGNRCIEEYIPFKQYSDCVKNINSIMKKVFPDSSVFLNQL